MIQHDYAVIKLLSGETIMCLVLGEHDDAFTVMFPIQMKIARVEMEGKHKEIVTGSPWCSYTDDNVFEVYKQDIITIKPLNESSQQYYKNLIESYQMETIDLDEDLDVIQVREMSEDSFFVHGNTTIN